MGWASNRRGERGSARRLRTVQAVAALALLAAPALGQNPRPDNRPDKPKSLLPPGFDTPAPAPTAAPAPLPGITPPAPPPAAAPAASTTGEAPLPGTDAALASTLATAPLQPPDPFATRMALTPGAPVGILNERAGGFGFAAFAGSNGRFLAALALRLQRPLPSRWAAITLRRALLSRVPGPGGLGDGDWVAARAGLLVRLGEVEGARRLVDALPVDRYTPELYRVAGNVALAAADIAGLCPIASTGRALSPQPMWDLATAMCAAMDGDDVTAAGMIDAVRSRRAAVAAFDLRLARRVVVLAGGAGRAEGINWAEVEGLTPYRYGVASAAGVPVPADRLAALGPAGAGWAVRNPALPPATRLSQLRAAAIIGTLSTAELASGVAALSPTDASGGFADGSRAARLRDAFAAGDAAARAKAMAAIRADLAPGEDPYGALLETATAAAALRPDAALAGEADQIIAALLARGDAARARAWWPVAAKGDEAVAARAWALLAAGAGGVPVSASRFKDWQRDAQASDHQAALLLAGLDGLGLARGSEWDGLRRDLLPALSNRWTAAIASAAARKASGEVALLAATGLQGASWADVPPAHLKAIVAALLAAGRVAEARQLAAEAVTRSAPPAA